MSDDATNEKLVPPYVAWKTFTKFIQHLKDKGVPSFIDRSTMSSMSGSSQSQLLAALKFLGLVQGTGAPATALRELCAQGAELGPKLKPILERSYKEVLSGVDLKTTTTGELSKRFQTAGISGGTVTTAIAFLIAASKEAGLEVSAHVKAPAAKRRPNGKRRNGSEESADVSSAGVPKQSGAAVRADGDVQEFPIPLPHLGVTASVTLPLALDDASWLMIKTIIDAYATSLIQNNQAEGEDDD